MKKIYFKPEIKALSIKPTTLLDGSGDKLTVPVYTTESEDVIDKPEDVW